MTILKVPVTVNDHIQGDIDAPITLLEYGDYECPYCRLAHAIVKEIQQHFEEQLKFVFRHFPLTQLHPPAEVAAETAEFAGEHGHFWEMHDLTYANQERLDRNILFELAEILDLSILDLETALENGTYKGKIEEDFKTGTSINYYIGFFMVPSLSSRTLSLLSQITFPPKIV
jgi:protein-disulfide isomerase